MTEAVLTSFPSSSSLVDRVVPGLGYRAGKLSKRPAPPVAIVVHTTGVGPVSRFDDTSQRARHGWACPGDAAAWIYGTLMEFSGHYVIDGENGQLVQVVPEELVAEHVGGHDGPRYIDGTWKAARETSWWPVRWPGKASPLDLAGGRLWTGGSCNRNSIGIEVAPRAVAPRGAWSDAAWTKLVELLREVGARYGIPLDREHVVTHSDASPLARSTAGGEPWDAPPAQWSPEMLEHRLSTS
jgi:hypothetical protein